MSRAVFLYQHIIEPKDPDLFLKFYAFCHQHFCAESVNFFLTVLEYRTTQESERPAKEEHIITKFVQTGAKTPQLVNITNTQRSNVCESLASHSIREDPEASRKGYNRNIWCCSGTCGQDVGVGSLQKLSSNLQEDKEGTTLQLPSSLLN